MVMLEKKSSATFQLRIFKLQVILSEPQKYPYKIYHHRI